MSLSSRQCSVYSIWTTGFAYATFSAGSSQINRTTLFDARPVDERHDQFWSPEGVARWWLSCVIYGDILWSSISIEWSRDRQRGEMCTFSCSCRAVYFWSFFLTRSTATTALSLAISSFFDLAEVLESFTRSILLEFSLQYDNDDYETRRFPSLPCDQRQSETRFVFASQPTNSSLNSEMTRR